MVQCSLRWAKPGIGSGSDAAPTYTSMTVAGKSEDGLEQSTTRRPFGRECQVV